MPDHGGSTTADGAERLRRLLVAVRETPIPDAPPPHDRYLESLGLNLLSVALRLDHVERIAEALSLVDSTHLTRSVSVDLDLDTLTVDERHALRSTAGGPDTAPTSVWVPVARQARADLAPVVVRDGGGRVLPTLTPADAAQALTHGMSTAFRMFLTTDPRSEDPRELIYDVRHTFLRSRWLIEAAIASVIDKGLPKHERTERYYGSRATDSDIVRDRAEAALVQLFPSDSPFLHLLSLAATEHLLVVELPADKAKAFLRYDAPVLPRQPGPQRRLGHELTLSYTTIVPRTVSSYHVTVEVPADVQVRRFFLTSDADGPALRALVDDMRAVAAQHDDLYAATPKLVELELQSIMSRLAEFGRRRHRDLTDYQAYLEDCYAAFGAARPRFPARTSVDIEHSLDPSARVVTQLARVGELYAADQFRKLVDSPLPSVLNHFADQLIDTQVDRDVQTDNDPRLHAGHAHWQRRPFGNEPPSTEPVVASVYVALVERPPTLMSRVSKLLLAMLLLVLGFGALLLPDLFLGVPVVSELGRQLGEATGGSANSPATGPIVTILLLLFPVLLSRLDQAPGLSVAGRLRRFTYRLTYAAGVVAVFLALCVASVPVSVLRVPFALAMLILLGLLVLIGVDAAARAAKRRDLVPTALTTPAWLVRELWQGHPRRRSSELTFSTVQLATGGSSRRYPALAAVIARASNAGSPAAEFEVTHFGPGPTPGDGDLPAGSTSRNASDTLVVATAGTGFRLRTWAPEVPRRPMWVVTAQEAKPDGTAGEFVRRSYTGRVLISPEVLNDPAQGTEFLVTLGYGPWRPDFADTLMVARAYHGMAAAAAAADVPILYLHSPAAPFRDAPAAHRADGSGETRRVADGMALRMLVGLAETGPSTRLLLTQRLTELAAANGFGLQVTDRRFGRVRGQWWRLLQVDPSVYAERKNKLFGWAPAGVPAAVRQFTAVGPARTGSSAAVAADFAARNIGVLAVSEVLLRETAFINVTVPIAPVRLHHQQQVSTAVQPIADGLTGLASDCGLTRRSGGRGRRRIMATPATDFRVLTTGPVYPALDEPLDEQPLWLSWALPHEPRPHVVDLVLAYLHQEPQLTGGRVAYYRSRVRPGGRTTGRAKLAVLLHPDVQTPLLSEVCTRVQREVEFALARDKFPLRAVQLHLTWRERWLNRTNIVM